MNKTNYMRHALSGIFPPMTEGEFDALKNSIESHGYDHRFPIITMDGAVIDGWHRYKACCELGIQPNIETFVGDESQARAFVIRANAARRHLSKAAYAAAIVKDKMISGEEVIQKDISKITGISQPEVSKQIRIYKASPETTDKIISGEIAANTAIRYVLREDTESILSNMNKVLQCNASVAMSKRICLLSVKILGCSPKRFIADAISEKVDREMALIGLKRHQVDKIEEVSERMRLEKHGS